MCGISGLFHYGDGRPASLSDLHSLNDPLKHRGPDDSGFHVDGAAGLAHRRLSIIDVEGGRQPVFNEDGSVAVVLNGEIYNYLALRGELEAGGHRFATRSDTESIVHLYEEFGESCFSRLRGMFAVAVWDSRRSRLVLARDRIGKKPLYYFDDGSSIYFASELKSFLKLDRFEARVAPEAVYDYLTYLCVPAPRTIFKDVAKVEPGCWISIDRRGPKPGRYWDLHFCENPARTEAELLEELDCRVRDAVRIRLMSEVPLGAFLSGGVDSSTVVAYMATESADPVTVASIEFEDPRFDESVYARRVANLYSCRLVGRRVGQEDVSLIDQLVWHYDEPFGDASAVPTFQLCREARRHLTVALSGDGSDEIFAGYDRYGVDLLENSVRAFIPAWARRNALPLMAELYPHSERMPRFLRAKKFLSNVALPQQQAHFNSIACFSPSEAVQVFAPDFLAVLNGYEPQSVMRRYYESCDSDDTLNRILYVDLKTYLPERMLVKVDRASMAHGLEVRNPFLDQELIDFLATVPSAWKLRNGQGKYILKKLMERRLPHDILHRPKQGFDVPVDEWFRSTLRAWGEGIFTDGSTALFEYFDRDSLKLLWKEHTSRKRNHGNKLWVFYIFDRWHRRIVG
jgi:asparagine synthase (glutamine-hydrolysing)